jgi:O-glycosyl hydrolase
MSKMYKKIQLPIFAVILLIGTVAYFAYPKQQSHAAGLPVQVWLTTADLNTHLARQAGTNFVRGIGTSSTPIIVNEDKTYQQMDGFGASFTDSSAWLVYNKMSSKQRSTLMNNLFSTDGNGIGLSVLRQPIGASDLSLPSSGEYTYDDMPAEQTDPTLAHFSIAHDTAYIIPVLQQASRINDTIKIIGTPWSPPGWMKLPHVGEPTSNALDGDITTRWSSGSGQTSGQWFQVDMQTAQTFSSFSMDSGNSTGDYAHGYQVFVSNDGTNWGTAIASGTGSSQLITVSFPIQTARYIRVVQTASAGNWWSIAEFNVYDSQSNALNRTGWTATSYPTRSIMDGGTLNPADYSAYANYFVKYIQAYRAHGLPIYAITAQNEPLYEPDGYPGMSLPATDEANFIANNLGPALAQHDLKTKILGYDHNWDQANYPSTLYSNAAANPYIDGTAWHCYGGTVDAQTQIHLAYPTKPTYETECSGGLWEGANDFKNVMELIINGSRNWAKTIVRWGMVLDTNNGPNLGTGAACSECRGVVTVDQATGNTTYNSDYYGLGQASKFVSPGAYRIDSTVGGNGIENVAFKNRDGSKVLVAYNSASTDQTFDAQWGGSHFTYTLPAGAAVTFKWYGFPSKGGITTLNEAGWTATASSIPTDPCCSSNVPANVLDGNISTRWSSGTAQVPSQWFQVDMQIPQILSGLTIDAGTSTGDYPRGYEIFVSNDGNNWGNAIASGIGSTSAITVTFLPQSARYIKIIQTGSSGSWWSMAELTAYSAPKGFPDIG